MISVLLGAKPSDPEWYNKALCTDKYELFDEDTETGEYPHLEEALEYCVYCPVKRDCLIAGRKEVSGIWGGVVK